MTVATETETRPATSRFTAGAITVLGAVGLVSAFVLTVDKVESLKAAASGEEFVAGCDINAFVSCSAVISSPESEVFGFPNSLIGVVGFTGVVLLGVLLLLEGRLPRLFWGGLQVGLLFAAGFITWLQSQSLYDIGRLCPYCMAVWAAVIPLVVIGSREAVTHLAPGSSVGRFLRNWTALVIMLWYVAVAAAVWFKFGTTLWA